MPTSFCFGFCKQTQHLCCGWWYPLQPPAWFYSFCLFCSFVAAGEELEGRRGTFVWSRFVMSALLWHPSTCSASFFFRQVLNQRPAMYPGEMGIYQDQMPLYINCTEVTHIYTNGSYQLVYQNCTPVFVNTKQVLNYLDLLVQVVLYGSNEQSKVPASSPESQIWSLAFILFCPDPSNWQETWGKTKRGWTCGETRDVGSQKHQGGGDCCCGRCRHGHLFGDPLSPLWAQLHSFDTSDSLSYWAKLIDHVPFSYGHACTTKLIRINLGAMTVPTSESKTFYDTDFCQ